MPASYLPQFNFTSGFEMSYSPYRLVMKTENARGAGANREGFLIRISKDGISGYSDLCPLPEYGQAGESICLKNETTQLAILYAMRDFEARRDHRNLLAKSAQIANHFTFPTAFKKEQTAPNDEELENLAASVPKEFLRVKVKCGFVDHLKREHGLLEKLAQSGRVLRLDFNSVFSEIEFRDYWNALPLRVRESIEYVEDPIRFDSQRWQSLSQLVPLAMDLEWQSLGVRQHLGAASNQMIRSQLGRVLKTPEVPFQYLVIKPALTSALETALWAEQRHLPLIFSSLFDHPVGQAHALAEALRCQDLGFAVGVCGLATFTSVKVLGPSEIFSFRPQSFEDRVVFGPGAGIGWKSALEECEWLPWSEGLAESSSAEEPFRTTKKNPVVRAESEETLI